MFAEGLQLPPIRLYDAGEPVADLHRLLALNSRTPERVMGDVGALVAGVNVAAERMEELADRFGTERLKAGIDSYIAGAESRMRDELARLAPGTYHGEYTIDGDGMEDREPVVRVRVEVGSAASDAKASGAIRLDFSETDDQALGAINAGFSQALTGALYAVRCFVDPSIPMNEGCLYAGRRRSSARARCSIRMPPAACGGRVVAVTAVCEAIVAALSQATARARDGCEQR